MTEKRNYFLKLHEHFFINTRMSRMLAEATKKNVNRNDITMLYLQLQLATLNTDGLFTISGYDTSVIEKMSIEFQQDENVILESLELLNKFEYICWVDDNTICVNPTTEVQKQQVPLTGAERAKKHREKLKNNSGSVTKSNAAVTERNAAVTERNASVTESNADYKDIDIDIDKDKEKDKDIYLNKKEEYKYSSQKVAEEEPKQVKDKIDYDFILQCYNVTCTKLPKIKVINSERRKHIKARLNKFTVDDFKQVFLLADQSHFLTGNNNRSWVADFDWLIRETNFVKTLEGKYSPPNASPNTKINKIDCDDAPLVIE